MDQDRRVLLQTLGLELPTGGTSMKIRPLRGIQLGTIEATTRCMPSEGHPHYYVATAPDGTTFARRTRRAYTHAVLARREGGSRWGLVAFAGSRDLAGARAAQWDRRVPGSLSLVVPVEERA